MTREKILAFGNLPRRKFVEPRGQKPLWLPNFTLTLLRTPHLPFNWAQFIVPLNMNKLDIKDYLWNAYGVPVLSVRSFIQQRPVQSTRPGPGRAILRRVYRPRSIKKMTVEMGTREDGRGGKGGGNFVWPDPPADEEGQQTEDAYEAWDKKVYDEVQKMQADHQERSQPGRQGRLAKPGTDRLTTQAQRLLDAKDVWTPTWQDLKARQSRRD